ncbi:MAG: efflux RND transporter permease subunit [Gammaproteobacteria bacterium]|nr:efflux RND transporter permease subunit [Gammaproteobacteria bacterium]
MATEQPNVTGIIGWFATNHVAANLLMFFIIGLGIYTMWSIKKETMPSMNTDRIMISMQYRGGTPEEVEEGILLKIEEAVRDLDHIKEIRSVANEGQGQVILEVMEGADVQDVIAEVYKAVEAIPSFPQETERPVVQEYSPFYAQAISVQISGDVDEVSLRELTEQIRNELLALDGVSYVELNGVRPYEISIQIPERNLREHGLTMDEIAAVIRQWSITLSGGSIKSEGGTIRVRAIGQAYTGEEFENITLRTRADGSTLRLGDIATVNDGFVESQSYSYFNGKPTAGLQASARSNENAIEIANTIKEYVAERQKTLPDSISIDAWGDSTYYLKGRLNMMLKNLCLGAALVFVLLGIFLRLRIAMWVVIGLPISFLGCLAFLPLPDITINVISLFGFIVVIGVVVDDAIIIAESASAETERSGYSTENIVRGAQRVAVPATFGVLTTVAAFAPLLLTTGPMSMMNGSIGWVVVLCLLFSLVESKLILPSHLALMKSSGGSGGANVIADGMQRLLQKFVHQVYLPLLRKAIDWRYATMAIFFGILILAVGLVQGGVVRMSFFPEFENDFINTRITLLEGTPEELLTDIVKEVNAALWEVNDELKAEFNSENDIVKHVFAWVSTSEASFSVELEKADRRVAGPSMIASRWRQKVGQIAGTDELTIRSMNRMGGGSALAISLRGSNPEMLEAAAVEFSDYLKTFDGLYEVRHQSRDGPDELKLEVKPEGSMSGLTLNNLARQVRQAFYGLEVQRIQRGESEIRVMIRYPEEERKSIGNLESMWIFLPDGTAAPFSSVASYSSNTGFASIRRIDGQRNVEVTANANFSVVQPQVVINQAAQEFLPELMRKYPGVSWALSGTSMQEVMALESMGLGFLAALFVIYALMAVPLKSYLQPLVIMSVIPFGIIGAILGHLIIGFFRPDFTFNMISMIGCIALSGVVVNDSLILVHYTNRKLREGADLVSALMSAGKARMRAIILTSLTTFFGLIPILLEQSLDAKIIHQMAVSIAFGIVFATGITLIMIPTLIRIMADLGWRRDTLMRDTEDPDPTPSSSDLDVSQPATA